ncbi:TraR/DksA C4-type zinc finger protein [Gorillibacterium sp. sgz5001074]|uniref:TraR/DksA C4-type zinc finger protein n=1 Tax=Gorillibacterium sp. sgz5001074 TaxID=3446695 RepID=UPI003F67AEBB
MAIKVTSKQIKRLRKRLLEEKALLEQRMDDHANFGLTDSMLRETGELSAYDNHPADLGTEMFERAKDIALAENAEHHLTDVNRALSDIEAGTYGICKACGNPIPAPRMEALPTAEFCVEHAPNQTVSEKRPAEEDFLAPPFGRTSLDERHDFNQFDGEDAWQIVESWGTSNSPAMAEDPQITDYNDMEIEADENDGYVEAFESFLATDMYGQQVTVVRNKQYKEYMDKKEGEPLFEPEIHYDEEEGYLT